MRLVSGGVQKVATKLQENTLECVNTDVCSRKVVSGLEYEVKNSRMVFKGRYVSVFELQRGRWSCR